MKDDLKFDVIVIGAGAAGLMCAWEAGKRGRSVALIDHGSKIAEKIRISGGGRCNFTNLYCSPQNFISQNPHFCKSALKRYTPQDFVSLIEGAGIAYHEKQAHPNVKGQLFCDEKSWQIIDLLRAGCEKNGVRFFLETIIDDVSRDEDISSSKECERGFALKTNRGGFSCESLVIATGGLSIPKIGASPFGYKIAQQFGLNVIETRPALVPLTFEGETLDKMKTLSGLSVDALVQSGQGKKATLFQEGFLFTHRGISGPSILQISSYWRAGEAIIVNLAPERDMFETLKKARQAKPKQMLHTVLGEYLPQRLVQMLLELSGVELAAEKGRMADLSDKKLRTVCDFIQSWRVLPQGSEGYRTAEVTLGGVDTDVLSSKTFEVKDVSGLYFIGEVVDVTGHLGGHNFQWAWSSGWCCGQAV